MPKNPVYFVYGASGAQGGAVAARLLDQGQHVRSLTRHSDSAKKLEEQGIEAFVGDMADMQALHQAHAGVDRVFLNIPVEFDTARFDTYVKNAIEAAVQAKVELLVVNTGGYVPADQPTDTLAVEIRRNLLDQVRQSGLPWIGVEPINYLENFLIPGVFNEGVLAYPVPADRPISWISLDDAAQYHVYALTHPELAGSVLTAPGAENVTGDELANIFASALGQDVRFVSLPFEHFEAAIAPMLGAQTAAGLKGMYQWVSAHTNLLPRFADVDDEVKAQLELSGIAEWVRRTFR